MVASATETVPKETIAVGQIEVIATVSVSFILE